jgi:hypothetical protein
MSENCARPGCGHPATPPIGDYEAEFCHFGDGCAECTCPAYRTQAQQEAWERVAYHLGNLDDYGVDDPAGMLRRLLELYP